MKIQSTYYPTERPSFNDWMQNVVKSLKNIQDSKPQVSIHNELRNTRHEATDAAVKGLRLAFVG